MQRLTSTLLIIITSIQIHPLVFGFDDFEVAYSWSYLNFTWKDNQQYQKAIKEKSYIPENVLPSGIDFYKDNLYISLPKLRPGVPVALAYINTKSAPKENPLLIPFPSWEANDATDCNNLQNLPQQEIDTKGVMWIIDGLRSTGNNKCPSKIILLDLNKNGTEIQRYIVPNEISLQHGGLLDDIVIDESDGGYAYISDAGSIDPGLVVYSRRKNRAWKLRDKTMFPELRAANILIKNYHCDLFMGINGIAMSPMESYGRTVYYTSLTGFSMYAINNTVLKNEELSISGDWRKNVQYVGDKWVQTDGMVIDNEGNLYNSATVLYGVTKWNIYQSINTKSLIYSNENKVDWVENVAFDQKGYFYFISNRIIWYLDQNVKLEFNNEVKFRIFKTYTGTKSYLYG